MPDRSVISREAAANLRRFAAQAPETQVLLGFDGFVDSIIHVVDQRHDVNRYDPIRTIDRFGQKVLAAAGQSSNFELVTTLRKLGGNGPIMANAMAAAGVKVTYIGCLGLPELDPVFRELAGRAEVHSISAPGYTDALEFTDGKLMMGKYDHLAGVDLQRVQEVIGEACFTGLVGRSRLVGMVNWTMLPGVESIWRAMADRILPALEPTVDGRRRMLFIDLCDPEKRTRQALRSALDVCALLSRQADVVLGMNLKESVQVASVLGVPIEPEPETQIEAIARGVREALDLRAVVVHPRRSAAGAVKLDDGEVVSGCFHGPFVAEPKLSTGAGDNFNAGFCLGLLAELPVEQALCVGTATSGYYVRHAASPTLDQLAAFCDDLPDPEL